MIDRSRNRRPRIRLQAEESGMALVSVIGLAMVMLLMVATALSFSTSGLIKARSDQNWNAALSAAYAGVDEYASRLSNDSTYQKYGNPAAAFTLSSGSALTTSLPAIANANAAFGIGAGGTWGSLAGASARASFRYEVDNSDYSAQGVVRIRSTGRVGTQTRSVIANLKQKGFINYVYFTDYELLDPATTTVSCVPSHASTTVVSGSRHNPGCIEIAFGSSDVLTGPVHSNDTLKVCKSTFSGRVSSSNTPLFTNGGGCAATDWGVGVAGPVAGGVLTLPLTNGSMADETRNDLTAAVPRPGCMYTGPTTITFTSDGRMRVVSPWTRVTRPTLNTSVANPNPLPAACGALADLNSSAGAVIPVPNENLIFVQNVQTSPTNPNYWNLAAAPPTNFSCTGLGAGSGWKYQSPPSSPDAYGYPIANEVVPPSSTTVSPAYKCTNGDVFVKGVLNSAVTVAAQNNVYITGDLSYQDAATNVLGLVAQNTVWVWNPVRSCTGTLSLVAPISYRTCTAMPPADATPSERLIQAAILAVGHTFQVQNFDAGGDRGDLRVMGAIAQTFRGPVRLNNPVPSPDIINGYDKIYTYDTRLLTTAPPKFLAPTSTTYGVTQFADVAAAFKPDGSTGP
ncbi:hypothetical protein E3O65_08515 [Cryobacterium breve]|uniref:Type 4 fimbrial biogenesis protein PilX N-terminal domain-containing protein n=3 Tax=Cryobacterium TaxID=69578 RepID=A0ABY2J0D2_9MICO|nr:hypothetical protein E3T20_13295 [Cryobacterium sp. TmT3-12]TFC98372.1 hypothetical protein E3O65_08515 [Cryobacterium breve]